MSKYSSTPVATPTLVYGEDVSEMDDRAIIRTIQSLQAAKKKNDDVGVTSVFLQQENAKIDKALEVLVSALDKLAEPEASAE